MTNIDNNKRTGRKTSRLWGILYDDIGTSINQLWLDKAIEIIKEDSNLNSGIIYYF